MDQVTDFPPLAQSTPITPLMQALIDISVSQGVTELKRQNAALRQKCRNQRLELRRLNSAHLRKNARIMNLAQDIGIAVAIMDVAGIRIARLPNPAAASNQPTPASPIDDVPF